MSEIPAPAGDRRPIAARQWAVSQRVTDWLVRQRVSANAISVAGAVAGIIGGFCFAGTSLAPGYEPILWLAGAALIQMRLLANMFDGMVAIASGTASPTGELYNDFPDRISDTAFFVGAGYAAGSEPWRGWAAALAALLTAYVRALGRGITGTQDFCGPMAKPHRMHLLCFVAVLCAVCYWRSFPGFALVSIQAGLLVIIIGSLVTSVRRLFRIADQLREFKA